MADVHGNCAPGFEALADAFKGNFDAGHELGASLHLTLEGETIVDLWGGFKDRKRTQPWQADTLTLIYSSTKIPTICTVLRCIDLGLLELHEKVGTYWPEFAQHGKQEVTVLDALTHRALVPGFKTPQQIRTQADWQKMTRLIEEEPAWFEPGQICYHPTTYGHILGELVERVTGDRFRSYFKSEFSEPMNADLFMGLDDQTQLNRIAEQSYKVRQREPDPENIVDQIMGSFSAPPLEFLWEQWPLQSACIPSSSGFSSARGLCRFATMLANDGVLDDRQYLSHEIVSEAQAVQAHGVCPGLGEIKFGLGFGLSSDGFIGPTKEGFHWGGYGGSWCFMDTTRRLAGAYVMNRYIEVAETLDQAEAIDPRMTPHFEAIRSIFS